MPVASMRGMSGMCGVLLSDRHFIVVLRRSYAILTFTHIHTHTDCGYNAHKQCKDDVDSDCHPSRQLVKRGTPHCLRTNYELHTLLTSQMHHCPHRFPRPLLVLELNLLFLSCGCLAPSSASDTSGALIIQLQGLFKRVAQLFMWLGGFCWGS